MAQTLFIVRNAPLSALIPLYYAQVTWRGAGAVDLAALEKLASFGARGFEPHPLRQNSIE